jgi:hypothetical protein
MLDDDATPADDLLAAHLDIHREHPDIAAVRGRCFPRGESNSLTNSWHYDLGERPVPYYLNLEGNSSIKRRPFFAVRGFPDELRGGYEGAVLSLRLKQHEPDAEPTWYFPGPIIHHDFSGGADHLRRKKKSRTDNWRKLQREMPGFAEFIAHYKCEWVLSMGRPGSPSYFQDVCRAAGRRGMGMMAVQRLLQRYELPELFPDVGWTRDGDNRRPGAIAHARIAMEFVRMGLQDPARQHLQRSHALFPSSEVAAMIEQLGANRVPV